MAETDLALALYRRALALDPTRPSPRVAIARLLHARGDDLAARLELVAALATAPDFREARLALAVVHRDAGRPDDAIRVLASHLTSEPADVESIVLLADALRAAGRDQLARSAVQRARRFEPDHPMALWLDGLLLEDQGRLRDARARWGRLIATAPSTSAATRARDALAKMDHALASDGEVPR
jgi:Flp pilus assembly protein TadD